MLIDAFDGLCLYYISILKSKCILVLGYRKILVVALHRNLDLPTSRLAHKSISNSER